MNTHVRGQNLTYSIANHIGIAIVTGVYSADNPIPIEAELCRQYDASRPVLREAVKMLTAKGLLGRGRAAAPGCSRRTNGICSIPTCWAGCWSENSPWRCSSSSPKFDWPSSRARRRSPRVRPVPRKRPPFATAIVRMQAADRGEDDPLDSDIAFHVAVLRGSRNRFYAQLSDLIATALRFSIRMTNRYKGVRLASVADHKKVADAIIAGKVDLAQESMQKLIQEAMDLIAKREAQERRAANRPQRAHST